MKDNISFSGTIIRQKTLTRYKCKLGTELMYLNVSYVIMMVIALPVDVSGTTIPTI